MDRLEDLKQTLFRNMGQNLEYENVEFLVLDYGSKKDDVAGWIKEAGKQMFEEGKLVFYRTEEPKFYTMAHSRNVAFKLATGDIVQNVDADNFTGPGFLDRVNRLACACEGERAFFAKSLRSTNGRLGFFKKTFIEDLGGYDESFIGYGHDDRDIMYRAWDLGFTMLRFGGDGASRLKTPSAQKVANYDPVGVDTNWRYTEKWNKVVSYANLMSKRLKANEDREWGKAKLIKNFEEEVTV
jgi:hypothetical protein